MCPCILVQDSDPCIKATGVRMCEFDEGRKVHFEYLPVTSEEFKNNKIGTIKEE